MQEAEAAFRRVAGQQEEAEARVASREEWVEAGVLGVVCDCWIGSGCDHALQNCCANTGFI